MGCPELGVDTRKGIFGLISNDPLENCFIDLTPNSTLIENVGVQMILSQLLALKGGSIGFFFSTFFRLNPHLVYFDLSRYISKFQKHSIEFTGHRITKNPDWESYYPNLGRTNGLGPFSLQHDWPILNWNNLLQTPLSAINEFFVKVLHDVSESGEPFIFSGLRWLSFLIRGYVPDLSEPGLGWPISFSGDVPVVIYPETFEITGEGTYSNPYRVPISDNLNSESNLLIWLGPDGPKNPTVYNDSLAASSPNSYDVFLESDLDMVETNIQLGES